MFRPMLAVNCELENLKYPVLCTFKYDGIRCVRKDGQALSRKLKPIPNNYVREKLEEEIDCEYDLDGELICEGGFNTIQSSIMKGEGRPKFKYYIFDVITELPYVDRMSLLKSLELPNFCEKVLPVQISTPEELRGYEEAAIDLGYEGVMLRSPYGPYKFGRSTLREAYLLKLKRFTDAEGIVEDVEEMMHNENPAEINELGLTKRSTHKEGMRPAGILGAFIVRYDNNLVKVSTGLTMEQRQEYWHENCIGKIVKFKFQESGKKELPRFPVFIGFRHPDDM
jgi:DNA ligase 1